MAQLTKVFGSDRRRWSLPTGWHPGLLFRYKDSSFWSRMFLIDIMGGGAQLSPLGTAATNRPIVPGPGDFDDGGIGGMIGRGNRSTRRKSTPAPLCPPQIFWNKMAMKSTC
jgi:hypothetical protein